MQFSGPNRISVCILFYLIFFSSISAESRSSYEFSAVDVLANILNHYEKTYEEKVDHFDLDKLKKISRWDSVNNPLLEAGLPPLQEGYLFFQETISYVTNSHKTGCVLVLARKKPLKTEYEDNAGEKKVIFYRYLIYRNEEGKLKHSRVNDEDFIKMLNKVSNATRENFGLNPKKTSDNESSQIISADYKSEYMKDMTVDDPYEPSRIKKFQRSKYFGAYLVSILAVVLIGLFFGYRKRKHSK
jgi:hypothetical protein